MAYTAYQTNKKTGTVYAFSVESYRDPVTKKPKSHRTYLGRVDPVTKMIVGKASDGKRNRSKLGDLEPIPESLDGNTPIRSVGKVVIPAEATAMIDHLKKTNAELIAKVDEFTARYDRLASILQSIHDLSGSVSTK